MTIKDCIQYEDKNIKENEVVKLLNSTEIMKNVSNEIYNDILWLLSHKELSYLYLLIIFSEKLANSFGITIVVYFCFFNSSIFSSICSVSFISSTFIIISKKILKVNY